MSVSLRTLYFTIAITVFAFIYYIADEIYQYSMNTELLHREQVSIVENYYNNFPKRTINMMKMNTNFIKKDKEIVNAFRDRDKKKLTELSERYSNYFNTVFNKSGFILNFIEPDGEMFVRSHKYKDFGSSVSKRKMFQKVAKTGKPAGGIELCMNGLYLRYMQPMGFNGELIGYVESGVHISFFAKRIYSLAGVRTMIVLDGEFASKTKENLNTRGGYAEYFNNTELSFDKYIDDLKAKESTDYVNIDDTSYEVIKEFALNDFSGQKIGNYVFLTERSILHSWFRTHILFTGVIALLSIVVLVFIIRHGFIRSIAELEESHSKVMRELVINNASLEERIALEVEHSREKDQIINQQQKVADMGQMLSAVSHHWRQPINAIGLYVQDLIEAYKADEIDQDYIEEFEKNNMELLQSLSNSIDRYRSFYRPTDDNEVFLISDVVCDINELLHSSLQVAGVELLVAADCGDVSFDYKKMGDIDTCRCEVSRVKGPLNEFRQSVLNIFFNAIDSLKETYPDERNKGEMKVFIGEEDSKVVLRVTDNGIGIKPDIIDKVFNPFFSTKDEGKGTGLGLYMAKTIVERYMHGTLTVSSAEGETVFEMKIPKA